MWPRRRARTLLRRAAAAIAIACVASSCINSSSSRGVATHLEPLQADEFVPGTTTREDVLRRLGPPSQVLSMQDETAFYYVLESIETKGLILIVYNTRSERAKYDRAVFFFDERDVLTDFAVTVHDR